MSAALRGVDLAAVAAPLSDTELVASVRAGEAGAMESLMRHHNQVLYRTARAILRDDAEAEDAVQEAYLQAYNALGTFRGEAKLATWLVRIVANQALMRRRKRARRAEVLPIDAATGDVGESGSEAAAEEERGPEKSALRAELRRLLEARIDQLPDGYRSVFVLRALEEFSVEETAAALGIQAPTVRTRFFRARRLLREGLARDIDLTLEDAFGFAGERCDRIVARVLAAIGAKRAQ